jgi:hypothetical protein
MKRGAFEIRKLEDVDPLEDTYEMLERTPTERMQLLEYLRSMMYENRVPPRLERFFEIVKPE